MRASLSAVAALLLTGLTALAQTEPQGPSGPPAPPVTTSAPARFAAALSYQVQRSNAPPALCGCFQLQGLRADFMYRPARLPEKSSAVLHHFSGVFELAGGHASNINGNGLDLSLVTYLAGPRYSRSVGHKLTPFAQFLLGGVHGFDSTFPRRNSVTSSANSFALAVGGGVDLEVSKHLSVRLLQLDYLKTALPNAASNGQNNLRIGAGIVARVDTSPADPPAPKHSFFTRLKSFLRRPFHHGS